MAIKHLLNNCCFCLSILQDALSWYTFDAAFVISNSAIAKKRVEVEDKGGNHGLFEHLMHSWVGYELVKTTISTTGPISTKSSDFYAKLNVSNLNVTNLY